MNDEHSNLEAATIGDENDATALSLPTPVTQSELAEFRELRRQAAVMNQVVREQRASLLRRFGAGALVESGPLMAAIEEVPMLRLSRAVVVAALGQEYFDELRAAIPASTQKRLLIYPVTPQERD